MTTEILGFIIILGAVIVLLARQHLNKSEDDPEVLEAATGRLRYELEQSADEIINRMTEHIDRLEKMLREADYKSELLQQKINMLQAMGYTDAAMQQMPQYAERGYVQGMAQTAGINNPAEAQVVNASYHTVGVSQQTGTASASEAYNPNAVYQQGDMPQMTGMNSSADMQGAGTAYRDVSQPAAPDMAEQSPAAVYTASADVPAQADMSAAPANNAAGEAYEMSPIDKKAWDLVREASMKLEEQYEAQANTMQSVQQSDALQQAVDIQSGNIESLVSAGVNANPQRRETADTEPQASAEEVQGIDTEEATRNAKEMIASGYDLEEIAKATGLGIGAVHLIKQLQEMKK